MMWLGTLVEAERNVINSGCAEMNDVDWGMLCRTDYLFSTKKEA